MGNAVDALCYLVQPVSNQVGQGVWQTYHVRKDNLSNAVPPCTVGEVGAVAQGLLCHGKTWGRAQQWAPGWQQSVLRRQAVTERAHS